MIRRGSVTGLCIALVLAGGLAACTDTPPPRIPDPLLDGMEQRVAELMRQSRETVVAQPYSADAWGTLGAVYQAHRLLAEADGCYLRAIELDPGDFRWIYLRAVTREVAGADAEELQGLFGAAARRRPNYTAVQVRLGDAMSSRGRLHAAREAFERALHLDADLAVAHRGLGQVLLALGDVGRGVSELERSVTLDSRDGSAWAALARARNRAGDPAAATVAAERALQLGDSAGAIARTNRPMSAPAADCPWDCEPVPNNDVGINDFLALLGQWATAGTCDFDGGTVGITDFLDLLANWGPCP